MHHSSELNVLASQRETSNAVLLCYYFVYLTDRRLLFSHNLTHFKQEMKHSAFPPQQQVLGACAKSLRWQSALGLLEEFEMWRPV